MQRPRPATPTHLSPQTQGTQQPQARQPQPILPHKRAEGVCKTAATQTHVQHMCAQHPTPGWKAAATTTPVQRMCAQNQTPANKGWKPQPHPTLTPTPPKYPTRQTHSIMQQSNKAQPPLLSIPRNGNPYPRQQCPANRAKLEESHGKTAPPSDNFTG